LKPEALLFDLGGVIFELDWERMFARWSRHAGVPASRLRERFAFDAAYERHERDEIAEHEYYASLRRSLGIDLTDAQFAEGWGAIFTVEIPQTVALLRTLRGKHPLYAFSNSNVAHASVWGARFAPALSVFDRVFVSCELGARKPERAASRARPAWRSSACSSSTTPRPTSPARAKRDSRRCWSARPRMWRAPCAVMASAELYA